MTVRFRQLLKQLQAANKKMSGADPNSSDPLPRAAMDRLEARIRMGQESTAVLLVRTPRPHRSHTLQQRLMPWLARTGTSSGSVVVTGSGSEQC